VDRLIRVSFKGLQRKNFVHDTPYRSDGRSRNGLEDGDEAT
jgi:hypothetical protein